MKKTESNDFDIIQKIQKNIEKHPNKIALIFPSKKVTFKELDSQSSILVKYFEEKRIKKRDRVVVMIPLSPMLFFTILALAKIGATIVFIDPKMSFKNISNSCKISEPKAFIGNNKVNLLRFFSKSIRKIPIKIIFKNLNENRLNIVSKKPFPVSKYRYKPDSIMFIRFTTGSTGLPKGVERTYDYMCNLFKATYDFSEIRENDIDATTFPMNILYNFVVGATTLCLFDSNSRERIVNQILENNVTTASGPPEFWKNVVEYCKTKNINFEKIHFVFTGGNPVSLELVYDLKQVFPKAKINIVYGSTEAFPISWIDINEIIDSKDYKTKNRDAMCVGKPHPSLRIKIIKPIKEPIVLKNKGFDDFELKPGETGEIIITGNHVIKNYFGDKEKTIFKQNKIIDDKNRIWHRTGDLGYIENDKIWFVGRMK